MTFRDNEFLYIGYLLLNQHAMLFEDALLLFILSTGSEDQYNGQGDDYTK